MAAQTPAKPTILLVDDEEDLRDILRMDLEDGDFRILEARGGDEAFAIIQQERVDLVISDVRMANGTGVELLRKVKQRDPKTPVVLFVSGQADISPEDAFHLGVEGIFSKPWDPAELLAKVKLLLKPRT